MRTNLFNLKRHKQNKIVLEEEVIDNPFLYFYKKYYKYLILLIILLALISIIVSLYYAIVNLRGTTKVVTNINNVVVKFDDDYNINSINMKPISGGKANEEFYERYGNVGLKEGVIFVVKEISTKNGTVTFFSDGTSMLIKTNGKITRISSLKNGDYGINENGEIIVGAKTKEISIVKTITLEDNIVIIYYSDNSCKIIISTDRAMLVRNSSRLVIENNRLVKINPSGVSKELRVDNNITYYEDGTIKIEKDNKIYVIRNSEDVDLSNITFPSNNEATIVKTINLKDGSKINYFSDGSAEIVKDNTSTMVRQSKDIIYNDNRVIEIIETKYAHMSSEKTTPDGKEIIYLDNGGALIKNKDGTYDYVYENSDIKYDSNGNIKQVNNLVNEIDHKTTPDGVIVIDLKDGNSIIIDENGYRIVETDKIVYDNDGNIAKIVGEEDPSEDKSIYDNHFVIENKGKDKVRYMVAIEVSDNYQDYAPVKLNPIYLKYNLVANTIYLENKVLNNILPIGTVLEGNKKIDKETYILYEGVLDSGKNADITLGLWLDYDDITNDYQNSVFVGTIKIYSETIKE